MRTQANIAMWAFIGLATLGVATDVSAASCYTKANQACKQAHTANKKQCKTQWKAANRRCKEARKAALGPCKEAKKREKCTRSPLTAREQSACRAREQGFLKTCLAKHGLRLDASCSAKMKQCRTLCFRHCRDCTMRGVARCVSQCRSRYRACEQAEGLVRKICASRADYQQRVCLDQATQTHWRAYYDCLNQRYARYIRCQYNSYVRERACYGTQMLAFHRCVNRSYEGLLSCRQRARKQCPKKEQ